jgi:RNA recognition motif-containing protein
MEVDGEITGDKTEEKKEDEEGLDETRLYVMNLPFNVTDSDLRELFGKFGDIEEI